MNTIFGNSETIGKVLENSSNNITDLDDFELVQEVYIGKTPSLQAIDKEFDKLIAKFKVDPNFDINKDPSLRSIEKLVKTQFGFKTVGITFSANTDINALTLTSSTILNIGASTSKRLNKKDGYYDKYHTSAFYSILLLGILDMNSVTGAHLTALLLHEIGHNFYLSPYQICSDICVAIIRPMDLVLAEVVKASKGINFRITDFINSAITKNKALFTTFTNFQNALRPIAEYINIITNIMNGVIKITGGSFTFTQPVQVIASKAAVKFLNGPGEFHADEVASMYGYSTELNEVFAKSFSIGSNTSLKSLMKINSENGGFQYDLLATLSEISVYIINPFAIIKSHPEDQTRIANNIKKLKKDLKNKKYPPELEAELMKNITDSEKVFDSYIKCAYTEGEVYSNTIMAIRHNMFGDKDIHSLLPHIQI